jgi:hypothetical protein
VIRHYDDCELEGNAWPPKEACDARRLAHVTIVEKPLGNAHHLGLAEVGLETYGDKTLLINHAWPGDIPRHLSVVGLTYKAG